MTEKDERKEPEAWKSKNQVFIANLGPSCTSCDSCPIESTGCNSTPHLPLAEPDRDSPE
ncbi:hypothetical protein KQI84_06210 [bacterium]|nr:hypothetical protein [bacterium]